MSTSEGVNLADHESTIWIKSDIGADGTYIATLEINADVSIVLTPETATQHAKCVLTAVACAEYDAAVIKQLISLGVDLDATLMIVRTLRDDRPPIPWLQPYEFELQGGVSSESGAAFLAVMYHGERIGQWSMNDARVHATWVMETIPAVDLDNAYFRALRAQVGLEEHVARNVVNDVMKHRPQE